MLASAIHELSLRRSRPMVRVSCAAIPDTLVESELFGRAAIRFFTGRPRRTALDG
jgi:formate hydrogenlyase transcriptional activator